jgi:hypothetical protein
MRFALPAAACLAACFAYETPAAERVPKWTRFEASFTSSRDYENPLETELRAVFRSPSGAERTVYGFWDGGRTWRVRFTPDETGQWRYSTLCSDARNRGLHARRGAFTAAEPRNATIFERHGPVQVAEGRRHFVHQDGTPFFWLGDTAWNGPLWSSDGDWEHYLRTRVRQRFNAVAWVATQWRGSPRGDVDGRLPYTGLERIRLNPEFFQRLDRKHDAILRAGLLSVPVMLWAISSPPGSEVNPGVSLPEDQAILLARHMLARWGSDPVVWFINGDGNYGGDRAEKWKRIGRGVFGGVRHAPVSLHPGGLMWPMEEFRGEAWLDICGYQSAHADSDRNSRWITTGPPAEEWGKTPVRPVVSVEGPYERDPPQGDWPPGFIVRRNHFWSLLNAHVAGIVYGAHGIWGWSDGVHPAPGHAATVWPHWKKLLELPAAAQVGGIREFFESMEYWRLRPEPALLAAQPGDEAPRRFVSAAQTESRDVTVVYIPEDRDVVLRPERLPAPYRAAWRKPDDGRRAEAAGEISAAGLLFRTPGPGDWLLVVEGR